jgi:membrane protein implicated in regulation of membrane protease activity
MADNNSNPNNVPPKEEIVTEKPYYDDASAPTAQLLNNYNQSQSDNNALPSKDNLPQGNQTFSSEVPYYSSQAINNNSIYNNSYEIDTSGQPVEEENDKKEEKQKKLKIFMNITLIVTVIGDSILLIIFNKFDPFIIGDDIGVFIIALVVEISTQEFVSVWFSAGALVAMCICYFVPFWVEIIIFSVVSLAALILTRPLIKRLTDRTERFTNTDEFVGKRVKVEKEITKYDGGLVKLNGIVYSAILMEEEEETIPLDSIVEVVSLKGNRVVVKLIEKNESEE